MFIEFASSAPSVIQKKNAKTIITKLGLLPILKSAKSDKSAIIRDLRRTRPNATCIQTTHTPNPFFHPSPLPSFPLS